MISIETEKFSDFLISLDLPYSRCGNMFMVTKSINYQPNHEIRIRFVPLDEYGKGVETSSGNISDITIYEDEWVTKHQLIVNRLKANLGFHKSIFARNCHAKTISIQEAKKFLDNNHILGDTRNQYRYGLFTLKDTEKVRKGSLVAVATFSKPRVMNREYGQVDSYEWLRYANLTDFRIVGGMGKLMEKFIVEVNPDEIMSYADIGWGRGEAYFRLGFSLIGKTDPIEFHINKETLQRVSAKSDFNTENILILRNQGNLKFIRRSGRVR